MPQDLLTYSNLKCTCLSLSFSPYLYFQSTEVVSSNNIYHQLQSEGIIWQGSRAEKGPAGRLKL